MAHNTPESRVPALQRGHEIFDLDVSYVRWFSLGVVVLLIVTAAAAFAMLGGFRIPHPTTRAAPPADGSASAAFAILQSAPQDELRTYRRDKARALEGYRWVDRNGGVVQIPIERAMELVAAEGGAQGVAPPQPRGGRTQ
ncbi:MAG: hypothetical protein ACHQIL_09680 [Steroidobacterales bacterium]